MGTQSIGPSGVGRLHSGVDPIELLPLRGREIGPDPSERSDGLPWARQALDCLAKTLLTPLLGFEQPVRFVIKGHGSSRHACAMPDMYILHIGPPTGRKWSMPRPPEVHSLVMPTPAGGVHRPSGVCAQVILHIHRCRTACLPSLGVSGPPSGLRRSGEDRAIDWARRRW